VNSVEFHGVSKSYAVYDAPGDRLKELLTLNRWKRHRDFWALRDVTFQVRRGETLCIIGENGSGKSTLLQLVAGILQPTTGGIGVGGRVAALLELGAGFNPEFTGRANVYLNGSILGLTTRQIGERYDDIEDFAGIGDFINQPVKTYSSGMVVRLAFAVAIHVNPEILLVDEALAVGDAGFRQRSMRKVHELRARGVTILYVTHSIADVKAIGDRALWLEHGQVADLGETGQVVANYLAAMSAKDANYQFRHSSGAGAAHADSTGAPEVVTTVPNIDHRHGDGRAEVIGIAVLNEYEQPLHLLVPESRIVVRISVRAKDYVARPIVAFVLRNQSGLDFSGTSTAREGCELAPLQAGEIVSVDFSVELPVLYPAAFSFSPSISDGTLFDSTVCDWIDNAIALQMERSENPVYGYLHLPCRVEVNSRLRTAPTDAAPMVENSSA
jgi:ABC-type polysaccharide/polyol phosphate transport system ATPase subunit